MSIVLLKTISEIFILGELVEENANEFILDNARDIQIVMSMQGMGVRLMPMNPFTIKENNRVTVNKSVVIQKIIESNIQTELIDKYKSDVSGITIAKSMPKSNSDIII